MIRTPNKKEGDPETIFTGTEPVYDKDKFIPGPVKKGL